VQQGNLLGISFHPEISGDLSFHKYFLGLVADAVAGVHAENRRHVRTLQVGDHEAQEGHH
jgi:hypothetical protein